MNFVAKTAINIAAPILVDVVCDMINPEGVLNFREDARDICIKLADKTVTDIDNMLITAVFDKAFTSENIESCGLKLISMAKGYVVMSETKYDDKFVLPVLQRLESVLDEND